jgi:hypothetical protein
MDRKQSTSTLTSILAGGLAGASETVVTVSIPLLIYHNFLFNIIQSIQPNS